VTDRNIQRKGYRKNTNW